MTHTDPVAESDFAFAVGGPHRVDVSADNGPLNRAVRDDGSLDPEGHLAENFRQVLPLLREAQLRQATVTFCGRTNVGERQQVQFIVDGGIDRSSIDYPMVSYCSRIEDGNTVRELDAMTLNDAMARLASDYLSEIKVNCDTGVYGDLVVDVEDGSVEMAVYSCGDDSHDKYYRWHEFAADDVT